MSAGAVVRCDDERVECVRPDGALEAVRWDELQAVVLETSATGPFSADVFWILVGNGSGCVVPQGLEGERALLARLQELPGFENDVVIAAMASTRNAQFLCWQRR